MSEEIKKQPEKKFRVGQIVATVWKNDRKEGQEYDTFSIDVKKHYKVGEEWKSTTSMNVSDLPKVELACAKAYEYLSYKEEIKAE